MVAGKKFSSIKLLPVLSRSVSCKYKSLKIIQKVLETTDIPFFTRCLVKMLCCDTRAPAGNYTIYALFSPFPLSRRAYLSYRR